MLCIVVNVSYMCRSEERGCVSACVQGCCVSAGGGETTLFNIDPAAKERLIQQEMLVLICNSVATL